MVVLSKVVAELRYRQVEPEHYRVVQATKDQLKLYLDGRAIGTFTGVGLIKACAEAAGRLDLASEAVGHGFKYLAPSTLVEAVQFELGGPNATSTPAPSTTHRARPTAAAAARAAAAAAAAVQLPSTPPAAPRQAAPAADSAPAAAGGAGGRGGPARVRVRSACDVDDSAPTGRDSSMADPELMYLLQIKHGSELVSLMGVELAAWEAAKRSLANANRQQEANLAKQRNSLLQMVHQDGHNPVAAQHVRLLLGALEAEAAVQLANLTAAEATAADRCRLVQGAIAKDPSALIILFYRGCRRPGSSWLRCLLVGLGALLMGVVLQAVSPQCLQGVHAFIAGLGRKCCQCVCWLVAAVGWMLWAVAVAVKTILCGLCLGAWRAVGAVLGVAWWVCRHTASTTHSWLCMALRCLRTCRQQQPSQQQQTVPPPPHRVCLPAAANAAAMYAATAQMHASVSHMRAYYSQHHLQQQQYTWQQQQQQQHAVVSQLPQLQPPSAADLSALVVGVSRLVQMEYGALHGQGECHLRDQVLRLLSGLLAVDGCGIIRKEQPMSGLSSRPPRSDLVVTDLQGRSLLVVEYKQRHSGAASACQQQDTAQLKKYLCDRRHGCSEGLLITFDKTLPNGLSATRVARAAGPDGAASWPLLLRQPSFCSQPLHHLESDPFAVGVMMGLCQGYGLELGQQG